MTRDDAMARDLADPVAQLRHRFDLPDGLIYLDGNSLGPPPVGVLKRITAVVADEWGTGLIGSWNAHDWIGLPARVGAKIARLIGAAEDSVVAGDSTSVQLFKLLVAASRLRPDRRVIVTESSIFPTDSYIAASVARLIGAEIHWCGPSDVEASLDDGVAALVLTHIDYRSGWMHDAAAVTAAAHSVGALACWDLCHSAGVVPVNLAEWDADFAVGCGYKYLNGGPGAPAFAYVHPRWHDSLDQPLSGWLGHADPFAFEQSYRPAPGIRRVQTGTPDVLSMSALDAALDAFDDVSMTELRAKSLALTDYFIALADERLAPFGVTVEAPREHNRRGSQVCLRHPEAYGLVQALLARGVVSDFRTPDVARFGFAPLYVKFVDIWDAVDAAASVLANGEFSRPEYGTRRFVT
ncbi:MAG TPA: kynureninase [Jiangellaceae bacterium]|nr:kynureninase [Jiangellaceae bacterium]